jgi:LysM repeat protein
VEGNLVIKLSNKLLWAVCAATLVGCATQTTKDEPAKPAEAKPVPAAQAPAAVPTPAPAPQNDTYTVTRGDHLWGIAAKPVIYGDPYRWPLIYKANTDKIQDADLIEPGQVLAVNRGASTGDVTAAVKHARTRGAWKIGAVEASDKAYLGSKVAATK